MAKIPSVVWLALLGGAGLTVYYMSKKKKFPFNEGSILSELKDDLSNMTPEQQQAAAAAGAAAGGASGITPGTVQSNPSAVDYSLYQNYLQGLKAAFPDSVPNLASGQNPVIAGDPNLFQNNNYPGGPPIQPYPGGALMPPYTQQQFPYYRPPGAPPPRGGGRPMPMPRPYPMPRPQGPPPWDDPWFEHDTDKYGRRVRKWKKDKPTATPTTGCKIQVGSICIGHDGSIRIGDKIMVGPKGSGGSGSIPGLGSLGNLFGGGGSSNNNSGGSGISVGGLMSGGSLGNLFGSGGGFGNMFGSGGSGSGGGSNNNNNYGVGTSANPQVIRGQVNNMLNDVFSQVGISR